MSNSSDHRDAGAPDRRLVGERVQRELALLAEHWRAEQGRYVADYSGEGEGHNPELPSAFRTAWACLVGVSTIGFGVWPMTMPGWGPFFVGLVIALFGMWFLLSVAYRHRQYIRARQEYHRRRAHVLAKLDEDELKRVVRKELQDHMDIPGIAEMLGNEFARRQGRETLERILDEMELSAAQRQRLINDILDDILGGRS
jgi:hypothetical protein